MTLPSLHLTMRNIVYAVVPQCSPVRCAERELKECVEHRKLRSEKRETSLFLVAYRCLQACMVSPYQSSAARSIAMGLAKAGGKKTKDL